MTTTGAPETAAPTTTPAPPTSFKATVNVSAVATAAQLRAQLAARLEIPLADVNVTAFDATTGEAAFALLGAAGRSAATRISGLSEAAADQLLGVQGLTAVAAPTDGSDADGADGDDSLMVGLIVGGAVLVLVVGAVIVVKSRQGSSGGGGGGGGVSASADDSYSGSVEMAQPKAAPNTASKADYEAL